MEADNNQIVFFCFSTGAVSAHNIVLKNKQSRCQGVVCATKVRVMCKDLLMKKRLQASELSQRTDLGSRTLFICFCCVLQEAFGFIERGDVVKEIFFHYSEFKGDLEALQAGDDVEFTIKERNVSILVCIFAI